MKRPTMLHQTLLTELGEQLGVSTERDREVIHDRVKHEGFSFLTITLPSLDDLLIEGIETGFFPSDKCKAFALDRRRSLPLFLGGFFKKVFNLDGSLLDDVLPDAIYSIRQITRFFKKLRLPCSGKREFTAIESFIQTEKDLYHAGTSIKREDRVLDQISNILWSRTFLDLTPDVLIPKHGPGATAERYLPNGRHHIRYWYSRMEGSFPLDLHAIPNFGWNAHLAGIELLRLKDELPVRVVFVPKTLKTPRVIAIEPSSVQFVQQSVMRYLIPRLESHVLTRNSVHFTDQSINQSRARSSSMNRRLATMDLSEASDRVSLDLVQRIFARSPILQYLEDSRSLSATLPNGKNILLKKFASMGSALCFPVEAMVFYTLLQSILHHLHGRVPSSRSIIEYSKLIDIYGDDIIIPTGYLDDAILYLESFGLKVNRDKTFSRSLFRESCGGDFYNGYSVKPVYAREVLPSKDSDWSATSTMSWASTANQLYNAGLWKTTRLLRGWIEQRWGPVPSSSYDGDGLYFKSAFQQTNCRYNGLLHRYEQRRVIFRPKKRKDSILDDGYASFMKIALSWNHSPLGDFDTMAHREFSSDLVTSTKRGVFTPKRRWVTTQ